MGLEEYIIDQAKIIVPALWIIGVFLKRTPGIPDWTIVWTLLVIGIVFSMALAGINVDALLQGIVVTGMAVLGHQLIKQTLKK